MRIPSNKIKTYKLIEFDTPDLTENEWNLLRSNFNTLGTDDTHHACGYFGPVRGLIEILDENASPPGLKKILHEINHTPDAEPEMIVIWNGR